MIRYSLFLLCCGHRYDATPSDYISMIITDYGMVSRVVGSMFQICISAVICSISHKGQKINNQIFGSDRE